MIRLRKKNRYKKCYSSCELLNYGLELNKKYEREISNYQAKLDLFKELYSNNEIVLSFKEHNGYDTIVTVLTEYSRHVSKFSMTFHAYIIQGNKLKKMQTLFTDVFMNENNEYRIHIVDFVGRVNEGYGSIVMSQFLEYIKSLPVKTISGWLSPVDLNRSEEHKELLFHFYTKFGFQITENNNTYNIHKILS